ncbi:fucolectin-1-like [Babylonia areolata]|uniref:fucolectin-1-like n=1 Tax=Babylonia areolata TaxID=304850 RepID=UPI003FD39701
MSSRHPTYGRPQKAVDGYKGTSISSCFETFIGESRPDRWWRVDLQGLFQVHQVVITNRGDCCGYRLADFYILLDRYIFNSSSGRQDFSRQCLHHPSSVPTGATVTLSCSQPTTGRFLTLVIDQATETFHFCEMEVLATPATLDSQKGKFHRHTGKKATADVIKTTWARSVIGCTTACLKEPGCTAVNLKTKTAATEQTGQRVCQLLTYYMSRTLLSENGWDFYKLYDEDFEAVVV